MISTPLYFVRPDEDWVRTATITATSEQVGYEAVNAKSDDPSEPWWANSGTATLTVTLAGGPREIGVVALIMTNADDGISITLGGGLTGSLTGIREISGYPRDIFLMFMPPVNVSAFTLAISGNTNKWSVGRVVAGKLRSVRNFLDGVMSLPVRGMEIDDGVPAFGHDIRYDVGVEHWKVEGDVLPETADYQELVDWYSSTRLGFLPSLVIPDPNRLPPMFARINMADRLTEEGHHKIRMTYVTVGRGIEVVG